MYNMFMTSKLGIKGGYMNKEEVLQKSRQENKNRDIYELQVEKEASTYAIVVTAVLATVFFSVQIFVGEGTNWGMWALVFSISMTIFWVKYFKLRRLHELIVALLYTLCVVIMFWQHISNLISSSTIL